MGCLSKWPSLVSAPFLSLHGMMLSIYLCTDYKGFCGMLYSCLTKPEKNRGHNGPQTSLYDLHTAAFPHLPDLPPPSPPPLPPPPRSHIRLSLVVADGTILLLLLVTTRSYTPFSPLTPPPPKQPQPHCPFRCRSRGLFPAVCCF